MDRARIWIVRILAPALFVAAAVILIVVVQRALEDGGGEQATPATLPDTVDVTTVDTGTLPGTEPDFYRIKAGDTLEQIAVQFETSVEQLLVLNPEITDALAIQPGQRIRVA